MSRVVVKPFAPTLPRSKYTGDPFSTETSVRTHVCCPQSFRQGEGSDAEEEEVFTGVNHAFHKHVNARGATLKGILKGCAEQNALGAAAASGCAYTDISDVYLLAARIHVEGGATPGTTGCDDSQAAAIFPCPECWRHLCHVARERHRHALPPLRLFVCAASFAASEQLLALAHQRATVLAAPMVVCVIVDCSHTPS